MAMTQAERKELARMIHDTLENQFAFFARPLILAKLDEKAAAIPPWMREKTVGELADAFRELRSGGRIK
jgi:hypothetical protein